MKKPRTNVRGRPPNKCTECDEIKPLTEFYKNKSTASGYQWKCKSCYNAYNRELHLRKTYGMSLEDYSNMLAAQGGGCAVCGIMATGAKHQRNFHVDHCHETGAIRGILCWGCNVTLGSLKDDSERIRKLADYIDSF